ncbi:uncharacterized protein LOC113464243, partial [Ceratina calcarata]|uniref:Uncharacterized protein LOC113464243 n=1 Tax=Ceratina calcarata TaxID=156304 RepID=A0AAJ7RZW3_9HYME
MNFEKFVTQYFNVTRGYGRIAGTWPFLTKSHKFISSAYIHFLVISALVTQTGQIVVYFSIGTIVEQIPFLMVAVASYVKFINYIINTDKFKELFINMVKDWQDEKTEEEDNIMKEYADRGAFYTYVYTTNIYFCSVVFFCLPLIPRVLDVFAPLNESRPRVELYPGYYFIENNDDYYYFIMLYTMICMLSTMCVFIATDTILLYMVQHVCGLLSLAGHRFKYSMGTGYSLTNSEKINKELVYKKVCYAIKTHKRALT